MKEARHVFCEFTYMECPEWVNPQRLNADSWLPVAEGEGNWKRPPGGHGFPFSGDENILEFDSVIVAQPWNTLKNQRNVLFKPVKVMNLM